MSFQLYVGNYPSEFSRKDVANIFKDYDGMILDRFVKKDKKCFSFLTCKDIDQVVSVIQQMNDATVSGRQLKVRASDKSLQDYVELLLQETSDNSDVNIKVPCSPPLVPLQVLRNETSYRQECKKNSEQFEISSCRSQSPSLYSNADEHCYEDFACGSEVDTASLKSSYSNHSLLRRHDKDFTTFTWVSVTNFPLGTCLRSIYDLFSDYDPIKVKMICNRARRDRTLTEAHVCFLNRDIANDVILNFDNTIFNGRILLVNDIEDLTVMNELLNVAG